MDLPTIPRQRVVVVPPKHARWGRLIVLLVLAEVLVTAFAVVAVLNTRASANHSRYHVAGQAAPMPASAQPAPVMPANGPISGGGTDALPGIATPAPNIWPIGVLPGIATPVPACAGMPQSPPVIAPTPGPRPIVPQPISPTPLPQPVVPTPTPQPIVPSPIPDPIVPTPTPISITLPTQTPLPVVIPTTVPTIVPTGTPILSLVSLQVKLPPLLPKLSITLP